MVDNFIILLVLKFDSHRSDSLEVMLLTNSVTESVQILYRFQKLYCLPNLMLQLVHGRYKKVVYNLIILLVLKLDSHKSDRLGVVLFTNSVTESVQILYRFQKLHCLLKLLLESVFVNYKKVVEAFLILLVLKFHN